jgi:hypothetical protein
VRTPLQTIAIVCGGIFVAIFIAAIVVPQDASAQALGYGCRVFGRHPCAPAPSLCGVFSHGRPCLPFDLPPLSEDLRLTITSTDDNDPANKNAGPSPGPTPHNPENTDADSAKTTDAEATAVNSIGAMYAALRACWVPPPKDAARHGMQYTVRFAFKRDGEMLAPPRVTYASHDAPAEVRDTYRDAVNAALERCTPLHFTAGMGGAVAGRPIAIRFVDNRAVDSAKALQHKTLQ